MWKATASVVMEAPAAAAAAAAAAAPAEDEGPSCVGATSASGTLREGSGRDPVAKGAAEAVVAAVGSEVTVVVFAEVWVLGSNNNRDTRGPPKSTKEDDKICALDGGKAKIRASTAARKSAVTSRSTNNKVISPAGESLPAPG